MYRFSPVALSAVLSLALLVPRVGWASDPEKDPDQIGNREVGKGLNMYSLEKEIALGQKLVRNSDARVPFKIKVIDSEAVNAFALPGGFFFVNTGLITKADSEAEL